MIPKVFHSFWTGPPMPAHLTKYLATWTRVHSGWEHRMWTDADLGWLQNQKLYDRAEKITPHVGQFRADIARYEILHRYGGVWIDCDFESLRPIDELLSGVECFAAWETDNVWVNNAILGAVPSHPLLADLIDGLPANVRRRRGKRPNVMTGPQYLTSVARRHDVTVFPQSMFYPYLWSELERAGEVFPDAYALHHWHNRRTKLDRLPPPSFCPLP